MLPDAATSSLIEVVAPAFVHSQCLHPSNAPPPPLPQERHLIELLSSEMPYLTRQHGLHD